MKEEIEAIKKEEKNKKLGNSEETINRVFIFERLIRRISLSKYNYHLILNGDTIMSLYAHNYCVLKDNLEIVLRDAIFTEENIVDILNNVLGMELEDGVNFNIMTISFLRNKIYKICVVGSNENVGNIMINIVVTKQGINKYTAKQHKYMSIFNNEKMAFHTYDFETLEALKFESIVKVGAENLSFDDLVLCYIFNKNLGGFIKVRKFQEALLQVSKYNGTLDKLINWRLFLQKFYLIKEMKEDWKVYQNLNKYAKSITYSDLENYVFNTGTIIELPFISEI